MTLTSEVGVTEPQTGVAAPGVEALREALRQHILRTSLRTAAREVGMSPTGLRGFVDGASPYVKTLRRTQAWYAHREMYEGDPDVAEAHAIEVLVASVPEARRGLARAQLAAMIAELRRTDGA